MNGDEHPTWRTEPGQRIDEAPYLTIYSDEVTHQLDEWAMRLGREPRFQVTGQSWDEDYTVRHVDSVVICEEGN